MNNSILRRAIAGTMAVVCVVSLLFTHTSSVYAAESDVLFAGDTQAYTYRDINYYTDNNFTVEVGHLADTTAFIRDINNIPYVASGLTNDVRVYRSNRNVSVITPANDSFDSFGSGQFIQAYLAPMYLLELPGVEVVDKLADLTVTATDSWAYNKTGLITAAERDALLQEKLDEYEGSSYSIGTGSHAVGEPSVIYYYFYRPLPETYGFILDGVSRSGSIQSTEKYTLPYIADIFESAYGTTCYKISYISRMYSYPSYNSVYRDTIEVCEDENGGLYLYYALAADDDPSDIYYDRCSVEISGADLVGLEIGDTIPLERYVKLYGGMYFIEEPVSGDIYRDGTSYDYNGAADTVSYTLTGQELESLAGALNNLENSSEPVSDEPVSDETLAALAPYWAHREEDDTHVTYYTLPSFEMRSYSYVINCTNEASAEILGIPMGESEIEMPFPSVRNDGTNYLKPVGMDYATNQSLTNPAASNLVVLNGSCYYIMSLDLSLNGEDYYELDEPAVTLKEIEFGGKDRDSWIPIDFYGHSAPVYSWINSKRISLNIYAKASRDNEYSLVQTIPWRGYRTVPLSLFPELSTFDNETLQAIGYKLQDDAPEHAGKWLGEYGQNIHFTEDADIYVEYSDRVTFVSSEKELIEEDNTEGKEPSMTGNITVAAGEDLHFDWYIIDSEDALTGKYSLYDCITEAENADVLLDENGIVAITQIDESLPAIVRFKELAAVQEEGVVPAISTNGIGDIAVLKNASPLDEENAIREIYDTRLESHIARKNIPISTDYQDITIIYVRSEKQGTSLSLYSNTDFYQSLSNKRLDKYALSADDLENITIPSATPLDLMLRLGYLNMAPDKTISGMGYVQLPILNDTEEPYTVEFSVLDGDVMVYRADLSDEGVKVIRDSSAKLIGRSRAEWNKTISGAGYELAALNQDTHTVDRRTNSVLYEDAAYTVGDLYEMATGESLATALYDTVLDSSLKERPINITLAPGENALISLFIKGSVRFETPGFLITPVIKTLKDLYALKDGTGAEFDISYSDLEAEISTWQTGGNVTINTDSAYIRIGARALSYILWYDHGTVEDIGSGEYNINWTSRSYYDSYADKTYTISFLTVPSKNGRPIVPGQYDGQYSPNYVVEVKEYDGQGSSARFVKEVLFNGSEIESYRSELVPLFKVSYNGIINYNDESYIGGTTKYLFYNGITEKPFFMELGDNGSVVTKERTDRFPVVITADGAEHDQTDVWVVTSEPITDDEEILTCEFIYDTDSNYCVSAITPAFAEDIQGGDTIPVLFWERSGMPEHIHSAINRVYKGYAEVTETYIFPYMDTFGFLQDMYVSMDFMEDGTYNISNERVFHSDILGYADDTGAIKEIIDIYPPFYGLSSSSTVFDSKGLINDLESDLIIVNPSRGLASAKNSEGRKIYLRVADENTIREIYAYNPALLNEYIGDNVTSYIEYTFVEIADSLTQNYVQYGGNHNDPQDYLKIKVETDYDEYTEIPVSEQLRLAVDDAWLLISYRTENGHESKWIRSGDAGRLAVEEYTIKFIIPNSMTIIVRPRGVGDWHVLMSKTTDWAFTPDKYPAVFDAMADKFSGGGSLPVYNPYSVNIPCVTTDIFNSSVIYSGNIHMRNYSNSYCALYLDLYSRQGQLDEEYVLGEPAEIITQPDENTDPNIVLKLLANKYYNAYDFSEFNRDCADKTLYTAFSLLGTSYISWGLYTDPDTGKVYAFRYFNNDNDSNITAVCYRTYAVYGKLYLISNDAPYEVSVLDIRQADSLSEEEEQEIRDYLLYYWEESLGSSYPFSYGSIRARTATTDVEHLYFVDFDTMTAKYVDGNMLNTLIYENFDIQRPAYRKMFIYDKRTNEITRLSGGSYSTYRVTYPIGTLEVYKTSLEDLYSPIRDSLAEYVDTMLSMPDPVAAIGEALGYPEGFNPSELERLIGLYEREAITAEEFTDGCINDVVSQTCDAFVGYNFEPFAVYDQEWYYPIGQYDFSGDDPRILVSLSDLRENYDFIENYFAVNKETGNIFANSEIDHISDFGEFISMAGIPDAIEIASLYEDAEVIEDIDYVRGYDSMSYTRYLRKDFNINASGYEYPVQYSFTYSNQSDYVDIYRYGYDPAVGYTHSSSMVMNKAELLDNLLPMPDRLVHWNSLWINKEDYSEIYPEGDYKNYSIQVLTTDVISAMESETEQFVLSLLLNDNLAEVPGTGLNAIIGDDYIYLFNAEELREAFLNNIIVLNGWDLVINPESGKIYGWDNDTLETLTIPYVNEAYLQNQAEINGTTVAYEALKALNHAQRNEQEYDDASGMTKVTDSDTDDISILDAVVKAIVAENYYVIYADDEMFVDKQTNAVYDRESDSPISDIEIISMQEVISRAEASVDDDAWWDIVYGWLEADAYGYDGVYEVVDGASYIIGLDAAAEVTHFAYLNSHTWTYLQNIPKGYALQGLDIQIIRDLKILSRDTNAVLHEEYKMLKGNLFLASTEPVVLTEDDITRGYIDCSNERIYVRGDEHQAVREGFYNEIRSGWESLSDKLSFWEHIMLPDFEDYAYIPMHDKYIVAETETDTEGNPVVKLHLASIDELSPGTTILGIDKGMSYRVYCIGSGTETVIVPAAASSTDFVAVETIDPRSITENLLYDSLVSCLTENGDMAFSEAKGIACGNIESQLSGMKSRGYIDSKEYVRLLAQVSYLANMTDEDAIEEFFTIDEDCLSDEIALAEYTATHTLEEKIAAQCELLPSQSLTIISLEEFADYDLLSPDPNDDIMFVVPKRVAGASAVVTPAKTEKAEETEGTEESGRTQNRVASTTARKASVVKPANTPVGGIATTISADGKTSTITIPYGTVLYNMLDSGQVKIMGIVKNYSLSDGHLINSVMTPLIDMHASGSIPTSGPTPTTGATPTPVSSTPTPTTVVTTPATATPTPVSTVTAPPAPMTVTVPEVRPVPTQVPTPPVESRTLEAYYKGGKVPVKSKAKLDLIEVKITEEYSDGTKVSTRVDGFTVRPSDLTINSEGFNTFDVTWHDLKTTVVIQGIATDRWIEAEYVGEDIPVGEHVLPVSITTVLCEVIDDEVVRTPVSAITLENDCIETVGINEVTIIYIDPETGRPLSVIIPVTGTRVVSERYLVASYSGGSVEIGECVDKSLVDVRIVTVYHDGNTEMSGPIDDFDISEPRALVEGTNRTDVTSGELTCTLEFIGVKKAANLGILPQTGVPSGWVFILAGLSSICIGVFFTYESRKTRKKDV